MEEDRREQRERTQSGTSDGPPNLPLAPEEDGQAARACDGQLGEDARTSEAETPAQEALVTAGTRDNGECLRWSPLLTEEELTAPSAPSRPSKTRNRPSEPCWYCLRSLDSEHRPETPRQENPDPVSPLPSSGEKVNYQTDPRPHFGVAWSSHSTCHPLWGSEGPCLGQRNEEVLDQTHTCPHCHLGLPADTLRWHEAKCLMFEGPSNSKK